MDKWFALPKIKAKIIYREAVTNGNRKPPFFLLLSNMKIIFLIFCTPFISLPAYIKSVLKYSFSLKKKIVELSIREK